MKILFIFTGGTIGSTQKDNIIAARKAIIKYCQDKLFAEN